MEFQRVNSCGFTVFQDVDGLLDLFMFYDVFVW